MLAVVALLVLGVVLRATQALPDSAVPLLDQVVLRVALPGLVLVLIPTVELDASALVPVAVAWAQLVFLAGAVLLVSRAAGWSRRTTGTLMLLVPLGNTSFFGFPAVEALLGADALPFAVVYDQLGSFLALTTYGAVVASRYGSAARPSVSGTVRQVVVFPPFVALVVAFALRPVGVPDLVDDVAGLLGALVTPLAMITVGMRLRVPALDRTLAPLATGLALRLVVVPVLVAVAALTVGDGGPAWDASVLEAGMPPMVTASVLAAAAGLDERLAASLVGGGVLLAAPLTLPLLTAFAT